MTDSIKEIYNIFQSQSIINGKFIDFYNNCPTKHTNDEL